MTNTLLRKLRDCRAGAMSVETAIVAPILLTLSLSGVEAGTMVARQSELQSAAAEALNIVQAVPPNSQAQRDDIEDILVASTGIEAEDDVSVVEVYRCGTQDDFVPDKDDCGGAAVSTYIQLLLRDTYEPTWAKFGIGSSVDFEVERTVQIS